MLKEKSRTTAALIAKIILAVVLVYNAIAFPYTALLPNDSVLYLGWSQNLLGSGLLVDGYRQIGFPIFLGFARIASELAPIDAAHMAVVLMRGWHLALVAYLIWKSEFAGLLAGFILCSKEVYELIAVLYPDGFVLLSICSICVLFSVHAKKSNAITLSIVFAATLLITLSKITWAWVLLPFAWILCKEKGIREASRFAAGSFAIIATVVLSLCVENKMEYDRFYPIVNTERTGYVLITDIYKSEDRDSYDNRWKLVKDIERETRNGRLRKEKIGEQLNAYLKNGDKSLAVEKLKSFKAGFTMGRVNDLAWHYNIYSKDAVETGDVTNWFVLGNDWETFESEYGLEGVLNGGFNPGLPRIAYSHAILLPILYIAVLGRLFFQDRVGVMAMIAGYGFFMFVAGNALSDNFRYIFPHFCALSLVFWRINSVQSRERANEA